MQASEFQVTASARHALFISLPLIAASAPALAATEGAPHLDGSTLTVRWVLPFVGILLSIALMPLLVPRFWHHHFGKVSAF